MKVVIIFSFLFLGLQALAAPEGLTHQHGAHSECALPKTSQDVAQCAILHHPNAKRAILDLEHSQAFEDKARQIPNPEVDIEAAFGKSGVSSTDIGLLQPIEWGGKRSSRLKVAESEIERSDSELKLVQAEVILKVVENLYRLGQLEIEKSVGSQTLQTLQKLVLQYSNRPALSPEQRVSLSVFKMALADSRMKQSELYEEEKSLEHFFHVATGHSLDELRPALPKAPTTWAEVSEVKGGDAPSPAMLKSLADRTYFLAEVASANAEAWPTLRLGPMAKLEHAAGESANLYGFRLMMDLPVFNLNGGGKAYSNAGFKKAEEVVKLTTSEESHERIEQVKIYRSAVTSLRDAPTFAEIDKDFSANQKMAAQGLVSSALVIELHRQRSDLIRSRHGRELKAIQALWQIYKYDGRIFQESL